MSYSDTHDGLCVLLEEYADADIETVATQILAMLALNGEDLIEDLNPPPGLQHWLLSHGLSLVTVQEARSPRVWEALEAQDAPNKEDNGDLEDETSEELALQVGDFVEYRTAPKGPSQVSQIGAGEVIEIGENFLWVSPGGGPAVYIVPEEGDVVRVRPTGGEP